MASVGAVYTGRMLTARAVGTISRDSIVILGLAGTIIMVLYEPIIIPMVTFVVAIPSVLLVMETEFVASVATTVQVNMKVPATEGVGDTIMRNRNFDVH